MIRSYADAETKKIGEGKRSRYFPSDIQTVAARKLAQLDAALSVQDLRAPPGNHLERLRGDRQGQHSIRINKHWRICFRWARDGPADVEIIDYH